MKKVKLIAGLCLIGQSVLFFVLFLVYWNKYKNLSRTLAVLSAVGGIGGAYLVLSELRNKRISDALNEEFDALDDEFVDELEDMFDGDIDCAFGDDI